MRAVLLAVALSSLTASAQPIVLFEESVSQYRDAAAAVHRHLSGVKDVDPRDPSAVQAIKNAPLVVAVGQKALTLATQNAGNTPVVFCMVLGITSKHVRNTVTGVPLEPDPAATLSHIRQAIPGVKRVGLLYNPASTELHAQEAQRAAGAEGLSLVTRTVGGPAEVKDALANFQGAIDVLWLPPDPRLFPREVFAAALSWASERKLPVVAFLPGLTEAGALASVHADYEDNGDRAGKLAADILSRPESKRVPVPAPLFAPGVLTLNLKTAKALGIDVPSKAQSNAKNIIR